jgi:hypothetical protein
MMKFDISKADEVARLYTQALLLISKKDYRHAKEVGEIAEKIGSYGYLYGSSMLHMRVGNVERAREIMVPVAEECCAKGEHMSEASIYNLLGMVQEKVLALEEHRLQYETKYGGRPVS